MSRSSHGSSALAPGLSMTARISAREFAGRALQLMFLCATAALFAYWLASPNGQRPKGFGSTPNPNCESFGRGGTNCQSTSQADRATGNDTDSTRACQDFGRGGLICAATGKK